MFSNLKAMECANHGFNLHLLRTLYLYKECLCVEFVCIIVCSVCVYNCM